MLTTLGQGFDLKAQLIHRRFVGFADYAGRSE